MSIIATQINQFGIVLASDSNLSSNEGNAGFGQKIFPIPHLNAGLAFSGSYSVDAVQLDKWMNNFIAGSVFNASTIEEFTKQLSEALNHQMRQHEVEQVTIIHIAGYHYENHLAYVEHWHISNTGLQNDGNYSNPNSQFHFSNDFNSRTNKEHRNLVVQFANNSSAHQFYINGFPPGRISYMHLKIEIDNVLTNIWSHQNWLFKRPATIFESASILKLYFNFVGELFKMSEHHSLYVGGETQTYLLPVPQNICLEVWDN